MFSILFFNRWTIFANFILGGTLFPKIMPNFCMTHALSIHKRQQFPWRPFISFFYKIKLILYPQLRNSILNPTGINISNKHRIVHTKRINLSFKNLPQELFIHSMFISGCVPGIRGVGRNKLAPAAVASPTFMFFGAMIVTWAWG